MFASKNNFMTLNLLTSADRSRVHTDRHINIQNLNKKKLFDVVFETPILVLQKIKKKKKK